MNSGTINVDVICGGLFFQFIKVAEKLEKSFVARRKFHNTYR